MKMNLISVMFLLLLSSCSLGLTPDGKALIAFKLGMKDSDGVLSLWNESDPDPCSWPGITCDIVSKRVHVLNLPFRKLRGRISPEIGKLDQLRKLRLHQNNLYGALPGNIGNCSRLKALYLRDNFLSGTIPEELGKLYDLVILDISSNSLSGTIPMAIGTLQKLMLLNLSTNFLVGRIPDNGVLKGFKSSSFSGNLGLCGQQVNKICKAQLKGLTGNSDIWTTPLQGSRKKPSNRSLEVLIATLVAIGVLFLFAVFLYFGGCFLYTKFHKKDKTPTLGSSDEDNVAIFHGDLPYSSKELVREIELLDERNVIGHGGFGTVYRLVMSDGQMLAVKCISKHSTSSNRHFQRELEVLGSIKHRNLVNFRGYYITPTANLLIYDLLSNGSLDGFLHDRTSDEMPSLSWESRLNIALGSARGLAYLHHDCSPRIIHCDVKASNILLGENLEPHLSDFGLAKLLQDHDSHVTTVVAGTFGYLAPEYLRSGRATERTDVYSYGIILLELISGKRPTDALLAEKGLNIVDWINSLVKEKNYSEVLDPRCGVPQSESLEAIINIALMCTNLVPDKRPTMLQTLKMLEAEIYHW